MHQALPGLCVFREWKGTAGSQGVPSPFRRGKGEATALPAACMRANRGRAERSLLALFTGRHERGRLPCSPLGLRWTGERDRTALLLIFHLNAGKSEGLFHEKFLPFKNLHILIQENKEKLSYTLEEVHYSIPTTPKARRQPATSLFEALWG